MPNLIDKKPPKIFSPHGLAVRRAIDALLDKIDFSSNKEGYVPPCRERQPLYINLPPR